MIDACMAGSNLTPALASHVPIDPSAARSPSNNLKPFIPAIPDHTPQAPASVVDRKKTQATTTAANVTVLEAKGPERVDQDRSAPKAARSDRQP